jgi:hypothetical protein
MPIDAIAYAIIALLLLGILLSAVRVVRSTSAPWCSPSAAFPASRGPG